MSWLHRHRRRVLVVALFVLAGLLFVAHARDPLERNWLDNTLTWLSAPLQKAFVWSFEGVGEVWRRYLWLVGVEEENLGLRQQLAELERQLAGCAEQRVEAERLQSLLGMRRQLGEQIVVGARVVAVSTSQVTRLVRLDSGADDGVRVGQPVVAGAGLVGRVVAVTAGWSEVQLLTDARAAVDVVVQRSRARGIVRGMLRDDACQVDHLVRTADVQLGDQMVTSGIGGLYPPGLLVGTVEDLTAPTFGVFREASIRPAVAFDRLENVLIVLEGSAPAARAGASGAIGEGG